MARSGKKPHPPSGVKAGPAKYGQGLFATRKFRKGQIIGEVDGERIHDPDYGSSYCIDLGEAWSLEPGEPFRFMNHSCDPNCRLVLDYEDGEPVERRRVMVEALRDIPPGTELTIDYEWPADGAIPCGCGAANCRGWIVDPRERHLIPDATDQPDRQPAF